MPKPVAGGIDPDHKEGKRVFHISGPTALESLFLLIPKMGQQIADVPVRLATFGVQAKVKIDETTGVKPEHVRTPGFWRAGVEVDAIPANAERGNFERIRYVEGQRFRVFVTVDEVEYEIATTTAMR